MGMLDGKIAILTGSGRGIGAAAVKMFAAEGASVVVSDLDPKPAEEGPPAEQSSRWPRARPFGLPARNSSTALYLATIDRSNCRAHPAEHRGSGCRGTVEPPAPVSPFLPEGRNPGLLDERVKVRALYPYVVAEANVSETSLRDKTLNEGWCRTEQVGGFLIAQQVPRLSGRFCHSSSWMGGLGL